MPAFLRLRFKSNNKASKSNGKLVTKKQKKVRQEQFRELSVEMNDTVIDSAEQMPVEMMTKKGQTKVTQPRPKDVKKEIAKLKIKIGKNEEYKIETNGEFSLLVRTYR